MVNPLIRLQVKVIQNLVNAVSLHPENVPVFALHLSPASLLQGVQNAVSEGSLELHLAVVLRVVVFLYVFTEIL